MVLPLLQQVAAATRGTDRELADAGRLARALGFVQPEAAETQLRDLLDRAVGQERFDLAVAASGELAHPSRSAGRLGEALAVVEQLPEFTHRAGLGPWTQLLNQGHRLTLLAHIGRAEEVLTEVQELRGELAVLPDSGDQDAERGIGFRSLQEAIDTTTPGGKLVFHVFDALAELNAT